MDIPMRILDQIETPVIFFYMDGQVMYANQAAHAVLPGRPEAWRWPDIAEELPQDYIHRLHSFSEDGRQGIVIECTSREETALKNEIFRLERNVEELEKIVDASSDELFVTDEEGRVLLVNSRVEELYHISRDDIVGKSVFDLERDHVFYPSVTVMVLRDHKRHTILQTTRDGRQLAVTGNPVFDEGGRIVRIISAAIDMQEMPWVMTAPASSKGAAAIASSTPAQPITPESKPLVASSAPMREMVRYAKRVATTDANILLLGETGVGKNRFARYIHDASHRRHGPFVEVNCAALPESLVESELFGYERGAFTGSNREGKTGKVEVANGGTLFLNEIGELPLHIQAKLLDFVQDHQFQKIGGVRTLSVDVRIIAATNRNIARMVQEKKFRSDLYYRLNVVPIEIPALRERKEDFEALCVTILSQVAHRHKLPVKHVHPAAVAKLRAYDWPGNVRELENVLERLCVSMDEGLILPGHLANEIRADRSPESPSRDNQANSGVPIVPPESSGIDACTGPGVTLRESLDMYEAKLLATALARWKTTYAIGRALDISQPTVVRKLKRYGLSREDDNPPPLVT